ncbi:MAG: hypothetical protein JW828_12005 [Sedimentisphaerales bacterium]|nr:hypothetical protein [Sedimentisphaerales bacterium]
MLGSVAVGPTHINKPEELAKWLNLAKREGLDVVYGVEPMHSPRNTLDSVRLLYHIEKCELLAKALQQRGMKLAAVLVDNERKAVTEDEKLQRYRQHCLYHRLFKAYFDCPVYQFLWAPFYNPATGKTEQPRWWRGDEPRDASTPVLYWPQAPLDMARAYRIAADEAKQAGLPVVPWVSLGSGYVWSTKRGFDTPFRFTIRYDPSNDVSTGMLLREVKAVILWPSPGDRRLVNYDRHLEGFLYGLRSESPIPP